MLRRVLKWNDPLASETSLLCCIGSGRDLTRTHAFQVRNLVDHESSGLRCSEKARLEVRDQLRFFLVQRAKLHFVRFSQVCTGTNEVPIVKLDQGLLLPGEAERIATIVDALHALIKLVIQVNRITVSGKLRCDTLLNRLKRIARVRARYCVERAVHARKQLA